MAYILCIDSSTDVLSLVLSHDGEVAAAIESTDHTTQQKIITTSISELCSVAGITIKQLDAVAVAKGPGSYTSLRIGASVAKGICFGLDIPLISINTLQGLAFGAINQWQTQTAQIMATLDARRMEIYYALFDKEANPISTETALVLSEGCFEYLINSPLIICGNGASKAIPFLQSDYIQLGPTACSAQLWHALAYLKYQQQQWENTIHQFEPHYFKPVQITERRKPLF